MHKEQKGEPNSEYDDKRISKEYLEDHYAEIEEYATIHDVDMDNASANQNDLAILDKQLEEKMSLEERKSAREAIDEILSENITNDDIMVDEAKVVEIISKKVA